MSPECPCQSNLTNSIPKSFRFPPKYCFIKTKYNRGKLKWFQHTNMKWKRSVSSQLPLFNSGSCDDTDNISKITRFTIFSYPGSSIATLSGGSHPNFRISQRPTQPRQWTLNKFLVGCLTTLKISVSSRITIFTRLSLCNSHNMLKDNITPSWRIISLDVLIF